MSDMINEVVGKKEIYIKKKANRSEMEEKN